MLLELIHKGAHLDGLGAGSENEHYLFHVKPSIDDDLIY